MQKAFITARSASFVVFSVIQIAFSWRALGLNGNPAGEILWGGYFQGADVAQAIIENADLATLKTGLENKVAFFNYPNQAVRWVIGQDFPADELPVSLGQTDYAVVITAASDALTDAVVSDYYGQKFVADSYPLWTWQPLKNVLDTDYWFWLIFRQGQMYQENHFIWVNEKIFQNQLLRQ